MPKLSDERLKKVCLRLKADDVEELHRLYGETPLGFNGAIRAIVSAFLARNRQAAADAEDDEGQNSPLIELDLEGLDP